MFGMPELDFKKIMLDNLKESGIDISQLKLIAEESLKALASMQRIEEKLDLLIEVLNSQVEEFDVNSTSLSLGSGQSDNGESGSENRS